MSNFCAECNGVLFCCPVSINYGSGGLVSLGTKGLSLPFLSLILLSFLGFVLLWCSYYTPKENKKWIEIAIEWL